MYLIIEGYLKNLKALGRKDVFQLPDDVDRCLVTKTLRVINIGFSKLSTIYIFFLDNPSSTFGQKPKLPIR